MYLEACKNDEYDRFFEAECLLGLARQILKYHKVLNYMTILLSAEKSFHTYIALYYLLLEKLPQKNKNKAITMHVVDFNASYCKAGNKLARQLQISSLTFECINILLYSPPSGYTLFLCSARSAFSLADKLKVLSLLLRSSIPVVLHKSLLVSLQDIFDERPGIQYNDRSSSVSISYDLFFKMKKISQKTYDYGNINFTFTPSS